MQFLYSPIDVDTRPICCNSIIEFLKFNDGFCFWYVCHPKVFSGPIWPPL